MSSASLSGTYSGPVIFNNAGDSFSGNGGGLTGVNATSLNGVNASNFWKTTGNGGTAAAINFVGTTDAQPLELHVDGQRALRLEPDTNGSGAPNVIGGSPANLMDAGGVIGGFIGGGGAMNYNGFASTNRVSAYFGSVVGGYGNWIQSYGNGAFIGGGYFNTVQSGAGLSVVAGGQSNNIEPNATGSVIGGGEGNTIYSNAVISVIAGGTANSIHYDPNLGGQGSTISGGEFNVTIGNGATIGGGFENQASQVVATVGGGDNNAASAYSATVAGGLDNAASGPGAFIGGGGSDGSTVVIGHTASGTFSTIGGGFVQTALADYSAILGGANNVIQSTASDSFIGAGSANTNAGPYSGIVEGYENIIAAAQGYGFVGGGFNNQLAGTNRATYDGLNTGQGNFIGAGAGNMIQLSSVGDSISGGLNNTIQTNVAFSAIDGGLQNTIAPNVTNSTILGGAYNYVAANNSVAAGQSAQAVQPNSLVWCDGSTLTGSFTTNSVTFRASGGYRLYTSSGSAGAALGSGATSWSVLSDRNAKKNIAAVDAKAVLDKLARVPIDQWNYKWEKDGDVPNIGPMAQDFKEAFYPGRDDKCITTLEFDGVELAAIQGLNQKLNEKDVEIRQLKEQNDSLAARLNGLEAAVQRLATQK